MSTDIWHPQYDPFHEYHLLEIFESQWCDDCKLPSVVVLRYAVINIKRPDQWLFQLFTVACRDCGITTYRQTNV